MPTFMVYTYREPALLGRLCRAVRPYPVLVHVDGKVPLAPFLAAVDPADGHRVTFLPEQERVRVNWAGYSQVTAIRNLMKHAVEISDPADYVIMLSGQDYPIKPMTALVRYLQAVPGQQFIRFIDVMASASPHYVAQIRRRHYRDLRFLSSRYPTPTVRKTRNAAIRLVELCARVLPTPMPPAGFTVAQGPTHFAITAQCALDIEHGFTADLERYFRNTFCPEEKVIHSLVANSRYGKMTSAGGAESFAGRGNWRYQNLHHIDPTLIKVFTVSDWEEVTSSGQYFIRKLETAASGPLLDRIDSDLLKLGQVPGSGVNSVEFSQRR